MLPTKEEPRHDQHRHSHPGSPTAALRTRRRLLLTALEVWLEIECDPDPRFLRTTGQQEHAERNAREIEDVLTTSGLKRRQ